MRGIAAGRIVAAWACLVLLPMMTLAQSSGHSDEIADATLSAEPPSASAIPAVAPDLPDAPAPAQQQTSAPQDQNPAPAKPAQQAPNQQPSSTAPTLGDLGFTPQQSMANAEMQRKLNRRTHDLKVHQTLGLITAVPMCATLIVAGGAKAKKNRNDPGAPLIQPSSASVDLHAALGASTAVLYGFTAYYAIIAPKIQGVKPKGAIRWHRDLVWIHAPGMILTPILGGMALSQENQGQKVHGIASAHSYVAWTTAAAYGASIIAVSWPIHLKFWEKE
ncbi:MAG: hypothetical protein ACLGXA_05565 [Acidobacteriota bacterium]